MVDLKPGSLPAVRLLAAQNLVAKLDPHPYYATYRQSELMNWGPLLDWLETDIHYRREQGAVLDIGPAYGTLLAVIRQLTDDDLYAIDPCSYMSELFRTRIGCYLEHENAETFPFDVVGIVGCRRFSTVVFTEVLEHLNYRHIDTLKRIHIAMLDEARLYLTTPNVAHWGSQHKYYTKLSDFPVYDGVKPAPFIDAHLWHFSKTELLELVETAGFNIERFHEGRNFAMTLVKKL